MNSIDFTRCARWSLCIVSTTLSYGAIASLDCERLDPRAVVATKNDTAIKGSAATLLRIGKVGGSIENTFNREVRNLEVGTSPSDKALIQPRLIYLVCKLLDEAHDINSERKFEMMNQFTDKLNSEPLRRPKPQSTVSAPRVQKPAQVVTTSKSSVSAPSVSEPIDDFVGSIYCASYTRGRYFGIANPLNKVELTKLDSKHIRATGYKCDLNFIECNNIGVADLEFKLMEPSDLISGLGQKTRGKLLVPATDPLEPRYPVFRTDAREHPLIIVTPVLQQPSRTAPFYYGESYRCRYKADS